MSISDIYMEGLVFDINLPRGKLRLPRGKWRNWDAMKQIFNVFL
jgi:hypothetical protein